MGATTITKSILDLDISLTISKLPASALTVEKHLIKAIFADQAIQFSVCIVSLAAALKVSIPDFWYSMGSSNIKVCLEDSFKITGLLKNSAEINVIIRELMEKANLAMRKGLKLELVLHTDHSQHFFGLGEDIVVVIKGL